jgi:hypothetical protein
MDGYPWLFEMCAYFKWPWTPLFSAHDPDTTVSGPTGRGAKIKIKPKKAGTRRLSHDLVICC